MPDAANLSAKRQRTAFRLLIPVSEGHVLNPRSVGGMPGQCLAALILFSEAPMPNAGSIGRASGHGRTTFKGPGFSASPRKPL